MVRKKKSACADVTVTAAVAWAESVAEAAMIRGRSNPSSRQMVALVWDNEYLDWDENGRDWFAAQRNQWYTSEPRSWTASTMFAHRWQRAAPPGMNQAHP